ncbi:MAG TPA: hypothetical protein VMU19_00405 [Bryobacteraceae bacterium]|nr:hypothetical protein [Bryobacteraceae bacterium]
MNAAILSVLLVAALSGCASAQICPPDADSFVQQALKQADYLNFGNNEQHARAYGDCMASALARNLRLSDFSNPQIARTVVKALDWAFRGPRPGVLIDRNKDPRAALLLLDLIAAHAPEESTKQNARELLQRFQAPPPAQ